MSLDMQMRKRKLHLEVSGTHDVYLVFQKPDTQIYTIQGK